MPKIVSSFVVCCFFFVCCENPKLSPCSSKFSNSDTCSRSFQTKLYSKLSKLGVRNCHKAAVSNSGIVSVTYSNSNKPLKMTSRMTHCLMGDGVSFLCPHHR